MFAIMRISGISSKRCPVSGREGVRVIRPQIVPYTAEWQEGLTAMLAQAEPEWTSLATLEWNPLLTFVAISKGRVVGFVAGYAGQPVGILDHLVVAPDVRGQGVGVALWRAMIRYLRQVAGVKRIRCMTKNPELATMLQREGFGTYGYGVIMEGEC